MLFSLKLLFGDVMRRLAVGEAERLIAAKGIPGRAGTCVTHYKL